MKVWWQGRFSPHSIALECCHCIAIGGIANYYLNPFILFIQDHKDLQEMLDPPVLQVPKAIEDQLEERVKEEILVH